MTVVDYTCVDHWRLLVTPLLTSDCCWLHLCWPMAGVGYTCVDQWQVLVIPVLTNGGCWLHLYWPMGGAGYTCVDEWRLFYCVDQWRVLVTLASTSGGCWLHLHRPSEDQFSAPLTCLAYVWLCRQLVYGWSRFILVPVGWGNFTVNMAHRQRHSCSGRNKCLSAQRRP